MRRLVCIALGSVSLLTACGGENRHASVMATCLNHGGVKDVRDVTPAGGGWATAIICRDGYALISGGGVKP